MIKQPKGRNVVDGFIDMEQCNIDRINGVLGNVTLTPAEERTLLWLCGWEESTVKNIISAFEKVR